MSICYWPRDPIVFAELFDGRLAAYGVTEYVSKDTAEDARCLYDGSGLLWAYAENEGKDTSFKWWVSNGDTAKLLVAIQRAFGTILYSEYEPQFYGFDTKEEQDAATAAGFEFKGQWDEAIAAGRCPGY
jgi:hypothetical protein